MKRRNFVHLAGGTLAASVASRAVADSPNDNIRAAVLGVNGRGMSHVGSLIKQKNVTLAVLVDPDKKVLAKRQEEIEKKHKVKVEIETDLRKVYDRKDIDAVTIATPNHWHALATIWACQAGKDVYVEKPGSHNIFEGRAMVEAAKRYKRIVQHGVQLRSSPAVCEAVEHLRKGTIGDVYMARGLCYRSRASIGKAKPEPAPAHFDWNLWQGPAQEREFSKRYVHYNWHWHWEYGNGDVGNQGVHQTDMCLWGLGVGLPSEITAMGGKFIFDDDKETPEVLTSAYYYPEANKMIEFEVRPWATNKENGVGVGNIFYGSKGYMTIGGYNAFEITLYDGKKEVPGPKKKDGDPLAAHFANWLDACRSRKAETLHGPVETAHTSSALAHLGNIAYRVGRRLQFDPQGERFVNASDADALLTRNYRAPFVVKREAV